MDLGAEVNPDAEEWDEHMTEEVPERRDGWFEELENERGENPHKV